MGKLKTSPLSPDNFIGLYKASLHILHKKGVSSTSDIFERIFFPAREYECTFKDGELKISYSGSIFADDVEIEIRQKDGGYINLGLYKERGYPAMQLSEQIERHFAEGHNYGLEEEPSEKTGPMQAILGLAGLFAFIAIYSKNPSSVFVHESRRSGRGSTYTLKL